jgi:glutamate decarboxylase
VRVAKIAHTRLFAATPQALPINENRRVLFVAKNFFSLSSFCVLISPTPIERAFGLATEASPTVLLSHWEAPLITESSIAESRSESLHTALDWHAGLKSFEPAAGTAPCHDFLTGSAVFDSYVTARLECHLASSPRQKVNATDLAKRFLQSQVPEEGQPADSYIRHLFDDVVPHSVRTHDPRFVGHMTSALPAFVGPLGRLITALNQNVVKLETADALVFQERQAIAILHRLVYGREQSFYDAHIQSPASTLGTMVSGGTLGNLSALWCARNRVLGPKEGFEGISQEGLGEALRVYGFRRAVIIGSSLMHYSLEKAADLLGIGRKALIRVPATERGAIDLARLEETLRRSAAEGDLVLSLVGIAGTTETGAVDPLAQMADLASAYGCHFHVDAAWGGPVLFSRKYGHRLNGIHRADSVTIDGHKQLYLPMGAGVTLFRDPDLAQCIETAANYIIRANSADPGRRTIEGSRPAMGAYLHAALNIFGRDGYQRLIDAGIEKAAYLARVIQASPAFELLAEPQLNIVVYRYVPLALRDAVRSERVSPAENAIIDNCNRRLQELQRNQGRSFVSRTTLSNTRYGAASPVVTLRAVLANPLTARHDLVAILDEQRALGDQLSAEAGRA